MHNRFFAVNAKMVGNRLCRVWYILLVLLCRIFLFVNMLNRKFSIVKCLFPHYNIAKIRYVGFAV